MAIKQEQGQTMVEYILLLAVAVSLVATFYNSEAFRRLFGSQGVLGQQIKADSEFSYRHAYLKNRSDDVPRNSRDGSVHPSYHDVDRGGTRFFGAKDAYPQ